VLLAREARRILICFLVALVITQNGFICHHDLFLPENTRDCSHIHVDSHLYINTHNFKKQTNKQTNKQKKKIKLITD